MTEQTRKAGDAASHNVEENIAQRQSDAAPEAVAEGDGALVETSDRADGLGSSANGVPAADDADGERRRKLYENGATLVSRID
jgi:hypothetical protein